MRTDGWICSNAALIGATALIAADPSFAEEVPDGRTGAADTRSTELEEIIVTATRRETPLSRVPASIHAKSELNLSRLNAFDFTDYALTVPSLSFTDTGLGGATPVIRGVQTSTFLEVLPTTATYLGEVPITVPPNILLTFAPDPGLVDIDRVEVLRGPQGTLFGASAIGGAIRILPAEPDPRGTYASWQAGIETVTDGDVGIRLNGVINSPAFSDRGAVRGVAYVREVGGYIDNLNTGAHDVNNRLTIGGRLSVLYNLGDRWNVTGFATYQGTEWDGNTIENVPSLPRKQDQVDSPGLDDISIVDIRLDGAFDWGTFRSITSWYERDLEARADLRAFVEFILAETTGLDPVPENSTTAFNHLKSSQFVQELRLVSSDEGRFNWLAGTFYQNADIHPNQDFPSPGFDEATGGLAADAGFPDNLAVYRSTSTLEQFALYGQATYAFTDNLDVAVGARQFWLDRREIAVGKGWLFPVPPADDSASESGTNPSISLSYRASENLRVYGRAAEGFRPSGTNPTSFFESDVCRDNLAALGIDEAPASYDSDSLWSYELGLYAASSDNRYRFNGAIYRLDWSDIQTLKFLECGNWYVENAGEAAVDGIELEFGAQPADKLYVSVGLAYRNAELTEDAPNLFASRGDRIPGVPEFTANAMVEWYFRRFGQWEGSVQAAYSYVGESYTDFDPDFSILIPSYSMTRVAVGLVSDRWSINLFINNLFDERGVTNIIPVPGEPEVMTSRPRTVGLVVGWRM